jgi:hypothetical protein
MLNVSWNTRRKKTTLIWTLMRVSGGFNWPGIWPNRGLLWTI